METVTSAIIYGNIIALVYQCLVSNFSILVTILLKLVTFGHGFRLDVYSAEEVWRLNPVLHAGHKAALCSGPVIGIGYAGFITVTKDISGEYGGGTTVEGCLWCLWEPKRTIAVTKEAASCQRKQPLEDDEDCVQFRKIAGSSYSGMDVNWYRCPRVARRDHYQPFPWQRAIIDKIHRHFEEDGAGGCTCFISGSTGIGKSTLVEPLAWSFSPTKDSPAIIVDYNPSQAHNNNTTELAISASIREKARVIIFVVDEVDSIIENIICPSISTATSIGKQCMNATCPIGAGKRPWNMWLDGLSRPSNMKVVTILTSNTSRDKICQRPGHDWSILRKGRITIEHHESRELKVVDECPSPRSIRSVLQQDEAKLLRSGARYG